MTTWTEFNEWTQRSAEIIVRGATPPNPNQYRLLLLNNLIVSRTMGRAELVSSELIQEYGYQRAIYTPAASSYNGSKQRVELPTTTLNFSAVGASLQWSAAVLMADSVADNSQQITAINPASNALTIPSHGRSNGDEVAITSIDTLASGIPANTVLYVGVTSADTIQLYSDVARTSQVDVTSAGVGTHYLRLCKGTPVFYANFATQLIGDGATQPIDVQWAFLNAGNANGV
ncbi:MAG TPA: hypothetical protein V6C88_14375 [Chroococcidiopsis sp.]